MVCERFEPVETAQEQRQGAVALVGDEQALRAVVGEGDRRDRLGAAGGDLLGHAAIEEIRDEAQAVGAGVDGDEVELSRAGR